MHSIQLQRFRFQPDGHFRCGNVPGVCCERFSLTNGASAVTTWDAELYLAWNDRDGRGGGCADGPVDRGLAGISRLVGKGGDGGGVAIGGHVYFDVGGDAIG